MSAEDNNKISDGEAPKSALLLRAEKIDYCFAVARLCAYALALLVIPLLPLNLIDNTSFCIIYHITGLRCPGCGMSRAVYHAMHLDFAGAYKFNMLVVIILPMLAAAVIFDTVRTVRLIIKRHRAK